MTKIKFVYAKDEITVFANEQNLSWVRTNLARITRGGHGGMLRSQEDVTAAFLKLNALLDQISICDGPPLWKLRVIELGWNFGQAFRDVETLALTSKSEWIRKKHEHIPGEKVTFKGAEFEAKFYNKAVIMHRCGELADPNLPVSRIEVTLRRRKLQAVTGMQSFVPESFLSFANFKMWLRTCIESFDTPKPILGGDPKSVQDRLLYAALVLGHLGCHVGGLRPFDYAIQIASSATRRNWVKRMSRMALVFLKRRIIDFFPETDWGNPVECGDLLVPRLESAGVPFRMRPDLVQDLSTPDDHEACASW